ncbi:hypothetical protein BDF21DRAFT_409455 [Thamnidium elegans]|nr:hypothetical protein BDF21DRAFT_409455 [Thamnidium elegans]
MYYYNYYLLLFILFSSLVHLQEYDDDSPPELSDPVNQDIYNSKELFTHEPNITRINDLIQVKMYCEVGQEHCKKVQNSLVSAATRLSQVLVLRNELVIKASYYSFCLNSCSNSTFGWGSPSSQFTLISLNQADSNFIYPQALAKQLRASYTDSSTWATYDIAIDINHDIYLNDEGLWFNSSETSINDNQVDVEYVMLHQIIHGLGMLSSWAPYFSDTSSPFQQLLKGVIPSDNLKMMTPNPNWIITQDAGPAYITGFQPSLIFDKFLNLFIPAKNITVDLVEYSFDMQSFCIADFQGSFIVNFMNSFLNNATQSSRAKSMYVSMSTPKTLEFRYVHSSENPSVFYTDPYLNSTYKSIQLMTGPDLLSMSRKESYYRPGISTSHVDDDYTGTPDFLMLRNFIKGRTLDSLIEEGYSNIPTIRYNVTGERNVNITAFVNNTMVNTTVTRNETIEYTYKSAIGPGILRILETIGYSTVLTNTNYTTAVIKTNKPDSPCDDMDFNTYSGLTDNTMPLSSTSNGIRFRPNTITLYILVNTALLLI